jgi:hypothetical protein
MVLLRYSICCHIISHVTCLCLRAFACVLRCSFVREFKAQAPLSLFTAPNQTLGALWKELNTILASQ